MDVTDTPYALANEPDVAAVFEAYAARRPEQPLVVDEDRIVTARQMLHVVQTLQHNLGLAGLEPGEAVGVLLPNGWRWLAATLALVRGGYIAVPLNTWYKSAELRSARGKSRLRAVISQSEINGRDYVSLLAGSSLLEPDLDARYRGAFLWDGELPTGLSTAPTRMPASVVASHEDTAMYVFTSGSSAEPKVVVLRHGDLMRNGYAMGQRLGVEGGDRIWFAAPLFFGLGCANAVTVALTHGVTLCLQERFDPARSAAFIEKHQCTVFYGVGPIARGLAKEQAVNPRHLSCLTKGVIGVTAEDKRVAIDKLGLGNARSVYGLTECYGLATMTEPGDDAAALVHTQGRALPTQEIRCVDRMTGDVVAEGSADRLGEIQLRGCTTPGYLNNDEANAASFTSDGWFRTGDLGWIDYEQRLHFAGRVKEVVKINGITISPAEVEAFITEHPNVEDAFVFGWPIDDTEEKLCCAVVLNSSDRRTDGEVGQWLGHWLRERISSYKVPVRFVVIEEGKVPMTATGKISKRLIGEQFIGLPASAEENTCVR